MIAEFDNAIKTLDPTRPATAAPFPAAEAELDEAERRASARLMRVNHAGEVAAQALYQGQALSATAPEVRIALQQAAREERMHLDWCQARLTELGARPSALNPVWYAGSLALGVAAGLLGDASSLGFVAETERQVEAHLKGHLGQLSSADNRSRAILDRMQQDEVRHGSQAMALGGKPLPAFIAGAMALTSKLMTKGSYWV
jgi:ubiquinone biosynthesis monooxygenase Coq7